MTIALDQVPRWRELYEQGRQACRDQASVESCPCSSRFARDAWISGWNSEDGLTKWPNTPLDTGGEKAYNGTNADKNAAL